MWVRINMNINWIFWEQVSIVKTRLHDFTNIVKQTVDSKTPEATQTLLKNNDRSDVVHVGNKLYSSVYNNDTEYANYVEYGIQWKAFNYNKPKWSVFLTAQWAWMFRKTRFELQDKFNELT